MGHVFAQLGKVDGTWLVLAGAGCFVSLVGSAGSWRAAVALCGGRLSLPDATARYGAGSLVNTFVPARAGDAVRIGLFSRVVPRRHRVLTTGGAFALLGAARALVLGALVVAGALAGAMPLWPLLVALGLAVAAVGVALAVRGHEAHSRAAHVLDAFREFGRQPGSGARIVAWIAFATLGRLAAATAVGYSLHIRHPLEAAIVVVPALDLAGLLPLLPGNIGITSTAIALAFRAQGVSFSRGVAAGITFHAVELLVGLAVGIASVVWLAPHRLRPALSTARRVLPGG